jgi:hypothetical protein
MKSGMTGEPAERLAVAREEVQVGMIVIRCPNTGREISTGMEADPRTYQRVPVFFSRTYCPTCRTHHEWFAKDARVHDDVIRNDLDRGIGRRPSGAWLRRDWRDVTDSRAESA